MPPGLTHVALLAGGGAHTVALLADGSIVAWGSDWNSQCDVPEALPAAVGIAAGSYHTVVLLESALPTPVLVNPSRQGNQFSTFVQTFLRKSYALEYVNSVNSTNWTPVCTNAGNGAMQMLLDPAAAPNGRFYRVRSW